MVLVMATMLPSADVRERLSPIVSSVEKTHERVVITKNGRPAAVLISCDDLESLEETLEILATKAPALPVADGRSDRDTMVGISGPSMVVRIRTGRGACGRSSVPQG